MIKESTRKLLRDAAIRNKLGGMHHYDKICINCLAEYIANAPNQLLCSLCKKNGSKKICKNCGETFLSKYKKTVYCNICSEKHVWNLGETHSDERKRHMSNKIKEWSKTENGIKFYTWIGQHNSEKMKEFNKTKQGKLNIIKRAHSQSIIMKKKIASGEFTPNITNSFTNWSASVEINGNIKKFRSSWEACVWLSNPHLKYESVECRTTNLEKNKVYIADFFDAINNIIYEIKPKSFFLKKVDKMDSIISHCKNKGYVFIWINEDNIMNYVNPLLFVGENIKQLKQLYKGIGYVEKN